MKAWRRIIFSSLLIVLSFTRIGAEAPLPRNNARPLSPVIAAGTDSDPVIQEKLHDISNIWLRVSNYGFFGNASDDYDYTDGHTGYIACRFPAGSSWDYLFQGGLWVGAIVGDDTLVSVGYDGWAYENESYEMFPGTAIDDTLVERSITHKSPYSSDYLVDGVDAGHGNACQNGFEAHVYDPVTYYCIYDSNAVSELDFIA